MLAPRDDPVLDFGFAPPLDDTVDRAVGGAARQACEPAGKALQEGGHRRAGIVIAEAPAKTGVGRRFARHPFERGACRPGAAVQCRAHFGFGSGERLQGVRMGFAEDGIESVDQRRIEYVEPDHRLPARVAVVVPAPLRRDDHVVRRHRHRRPIDGGQRPPALDDEADRGLAVAVARRDLAGQHQLKPGIERLRRPHGAGEARVLQDQHAAEGILRADQTAGFHQPRPQFVEAPDRRSGRCPGAGKVDAPPPHPERA